MNNKELLTQLMNKPITEFQGEYRFLSNFWPCEVKFDGVTYPSVEHAYQAAKTLQLNERAEILVAEKPSTAKRLGHKVTKRDNWENIRVGIMKGLLEQKFRPGTTLAHQLLETKNKELIEGNVWHDTFWGVCNGKGENWLGKLLMEIRNSLRT